MFVKKVKLRAIFLLSFLTIISIIIFLILKSLEENVVYFFSPSDIYNKSNISFNKKIRIGGLVKKNSIITKKTSINFIVTDYKNEIIVTYNGIVPNLFAEEKGVIVEGLLNDKKYFVATTILAKHDENYMPPEVASSLNNIKN